MQEGLDSDLGGDLIPPLLRLVGALESQRANGNRRTVNVGWRGFRHEDKLTSVHVAVDDAVPEEAGGAGRREKRVQIRTREQVIDFVELRG